MKLAMTMNGFRLTAFLVTSACFSGTANCAAPASDVSEALGNLGLNAETLAAVDVQPSEVPIVLDRMMEQFSYFDSLVNTQSQLDDLRFEQAICDETLRASPENAEAVATKSQVDQQVADLEIAVEGMRQLLVLSLLEEVADINFVQQIILCEGEITQLPASYRIALPDAEGVRELHWALKLENRLGGDTAQLPAEAAAVLSSARSQVNVNICLARIASYESMNQLAIDQWIDSN